LIICLLLSLKNEFRGMQLDPLETAIFELHFEILGAFSDVSFI
jgi:hypothetical protein